MLFNSWRFWSGLAVLIFLVAGLVVRSKKPWIPVWCIMAFSSFMVVSSGLVSFDEVDRVVNMDVILFLIGMFSLVGLADSSGLLNVVSMRFISLFKNRFALIYASSLLFGILAAFAVNDTVALVGPLIAYTISKAAKVGPKLMFLLLAFSLTIGSVMTPIGNPQNILIAVESGIEAPFINFIAKLAIPTFINLLVTPYLLIKLFKVKNETLNFSSNNMEALNNGRDSILAAIGIIATIFALIFNDLLQLYGGPHITYRGVIPFVIAAGIFMFTSNPRKMLAGVDWGTIVFFITMFITMEGVWRSGVLQPVLSFIIPSKTEGVLGILKITFASILLSQLLSNVPFVKLFINYMKDIGYTSQDVDAWLSLAMASTIAGNLTLLGAASNIIVLETLESRMKETITFVEFMKYGIVIAFVNCIVYLVFFIIL
ncbi:MAG: SLC13 family permease [Archaeoglobales archaeon]|nr:SLC13 family permease [Archaeoglobales archaeon]